MWVGAIEEWGGGGGGGGGCFFFNGTATTEIYTLSLHDALPICPPEDVGGVWSYEDFLGAIADPKHERHEEFMDWNGPFDPDDFDPKKTTREMKKGLPDWRKME